MLDLSLDKRSKWQTLKASLSVDVTEETRKRESPALLNAHQCEDNAHQCEDTAVHSLLFQRMALVRPQSGTLFSHPYWMNHSRWEFWFCDWKYFGVALSKRDSDHIPSSSMWWLLWCGNLARLQPPVIQSNVSLDVAMKGFCRCNESPSSLTLGKEDHSGSSGWAWCH